ncbi:TraB/GumN family protein [Paraburkholderia dinghuensis]|uniref:TraB/GumN family protein n=1 Tax=Paraburkholderia dinghuensis TaxID=2305225 RepID=A0A3N6MKP3_9BURK|nr:TraB/GumN family protein [Paraburkholderia dinghuensis]
MLVPDMHIPYAGLRQPLPSVLRGRSRLVIESSVIQGPQPVRQDLRDMLAPNALASLETHHELERAPWAMMLSDQDVAVLKRRGQCARPAFSAEVVDFMLAMKSAAGAASVASQRCAGAGQLSRDKILTQAAARLEVPVVTLETQVAVDAQRNAVPEPIYQEQLRMALAPDVEGTYVAMVAALNRGDFDAVLEQVSTGYANPADAATFYRIMIEQRNRAWMTPLQRYLDQGNAVVLVGAGHLPGPAGLIRLLTQAGYRVEPTILPADPGQG